MYSVKLFLGLLITDELHSALSEVDRKILSLFVGSEENYLKEIKKNEKQYLGKCIDKPIDLPSLDLLQKNIYSLLKKIVSDYPFEKKSLVLFSIQASEC